MVATDEQVKLIRALLRIDDDTDESVKIIKLYIGAAEIWLKNAGVAPDYDNELYVNVVAAYVGQQYDNPEGGASKTGDITLTAMVEQLRLQQKEGGDTT